MSGLSQMGVGERLARAIGRWRRRDDEASSAESRGPMDADTRVSVGALLRAALVEQGRAVAAPSEERARDHANEAARLYAAARELRERQQAAREIEERVREAGGVWFPTDGPL